MGIHQILLFLYTTSNIIYVAALVAVQAFIHMMALLSILSAFLHGLSHLQGQLFTIQLEANSDSVKLKLMEHWVPHPFANNWNKLDVYE